MSVPPQLAQKLLTDDQVAQYHAAGYLIVPNLLTPEAAATWKEQLKARLVAEGRLDEPSGVRVWMADNLDPFSEEQIQTPATIAILQQLIGPNVEFLSMKAVFKNSKTTFNSPWHQDWHYWQGAPKISVWIALDDATPENGCLRLVPGSHRQVIEMQTIEDGKGFNRRITDEQLAGLPIVNAPVPRGAAIFFHDLLLHGSCPNVNGQERWSAITTYRDAGEKDSSTVWDTATVLSGQSVNI